MQIYPNCPFTMRTIEIGGLMKLQLIQKLRQHSILINEYGRRLLSDDRFTVSEEKYSLHTIELTVRNLGFPNGATMPQIFTQAKELELQLCPLELGIHLRLAYLDQPEGYIENNLQQHQAPTGSLTIASEIISEDDDFPNGFYLRKINGVLWLRGYVADHLHVWSPDDHIVFCQMKLD